MTDLKAVREALDYATSLDHTLKCVRHDPLKRFADNTIVCDLINSDGVVAYDIPEPECLAFANAPQWLNEMADEIEQLRAELKISEDQSVTLMQEGDVLRALLKKCSRYVTEGGGIGMQDEIDAMVSAQGGNDGNE